jgi:hypothetical protein
VMSGSAGRRVVLGSSASELRHTLGDEGGNSLSRIICAAGGHNRVLFSMDLIREPVSTLCVTWMNQRTFFFCLLDEFHCVRRISMPA